MAGHRDIRDRQKMRVKDRERLRAIIETEEIIGKLNSFATAPIESDEDGRRMIADDRYMTSDQLSASFGLLKKVLPDLASVEYVPDPESAADLTDEQLAALVRASGITDHTGPGNGRLN